MADDFRDLMRRFIRGFGLLSGDQTPCGKPLPVSDAHALMCLREAGDDGLAQTALGAGLGIDKSTTSRVVARMTERGHVAVAGSPDDGRVRAIRLTAKGQRVARDVDDASQRRFAALLAAVPARRRGDVVAALRDLVAALDHLDDDGGSS